MPLEQSTGREQLNEVIQRAQESLDAAQLLGQEEQTPLIFEVMRRGEKGEERHMQPYVHPGVVPRSEDDVEEVFELLKSNSRKLRIGETWPRQTNALGEAQSYNFPRKKEYLHSLRKRYEHWEIPMNFAATGLMYHAWRAYAFDSTKLQGPYSGEEGREHKVQLDKALLMEIEAGESTEDLLKRMGHMLGFTITGDGNPVDLEGLGESGRLILPPDLLGKNSNTTAISPQFVENLRLYNWIEYSLIHRLEYGIQSERRLLSHYPLIADNCWYLGFAYCFVNAPDSDRELTQLQESRSHRQKGVFDTFASFNLRNALVRQEVEEFSGNNTSEFLLQDELWSKKETYVCKEIVKKVLVCFDWEQRSSDNGNSILNMRPDINRLGGIQEGDVVRSVKSVLRYIKRQIKEERKRLRGGRLYFYDKAFKALEHFLPNIRSKSAHTNAELNAKAFFLEVASYSVRQLVFPNEDPKGYDGKTVLRMLDNLFTNIMSNYDTCCCNNKTIGASTSRLLYEVIQNEWDKEKSISGIEWLDAQIKIKDGCVLLKHHKKVYLDQAQSMCKGVVKAEKDEENNDSLEREGIPLMVDLVKSLKGTAKWLFYESQPTQQLAEVEYDCIKLSVPQYMLEENGLDHREPASTKINWELSIEIPRTKKSE